MKRDDFMLLTLTFLTGLAIGMYIYIAVFKPLYVPEDISDTEAEASEWSLVATRYGGDRMGGYADPTFRLLGDGQYTYIPGGPENIPVEPREGKLSGSLMRELRTYDNSLLEYSYTTARNDCDSYVDGFDYNYRFTKQNIVFLLDTCDTTLSDDTALARLLIQIWNEVEGRGGMGGGNFSDWAEGWIQDNLGVE